MKEKKGGRERPLQLYLDGRLEKGLFKQREARLRATIETLDRERDDLGDRLDAHTTAEDWMLAIEDLAHKIADSLDIADSRFDTKRRVIKLLDVRATLVVEDGDPVVYLRCLLGDERLSHTSATIRSDGHGQQTNLLISRRFVL